MSEVSTPLIRFIEESNKIEGIERSPTVNEIKAHEMILSLKELTVSSIKDFVWMVARAELRDRSGMNVIVGHHIPPPGGPEIREKLENFIAKINRLAYAPFKAHCEYEKLHPFQDGNGRSGRVIWAWQKSKEGYDPLSNLSFLHRFYYESLSNYR